MVWLDQAGVVSAITRSGCVGSSRAKEVGERARESKEAHQLKMTIPSDDVITNDQVTKVPMVVGNRAPRR